MNTNFPDYINGNMEEYSNILKQEDEMRENMYKPENKDKEYNTNPYYNLVKLEYNNKRLPGTSFINNAERKLNIFKNKELLYKSYKHVYERIYIPTIIKKLDKYKDNIFIAGGYAFSQIMESISNDIDIFIHSCDHEKYDEILKYIIKTLVNFEKGKYTQIQLMRTNHAITVKSDRKYQIILRLYKSPSEILHGFDVDSCCVGMDHTGLYFTKRAIHAIINGYNTVNFDRMSPSYEYRLVKYAKKGIAIKITNFDKKKIEVKKFLIDNIDKKELQGLDVILYSYLNKKYRYAYQDVKGTETSDYDENGGGYHIEIRSFLEYNKLNYLIIPDESEDKSFPSISNPYDYKSNEPVVKDHELQDVMAYLRDKYGAVILSTSRVNEALDHIRKNNDRPLSQPEQMKPYLDYLINIPKEKIYMILYSMRKENIKDLDKVIDSILNIPKIVFFTLSNIKPWHIPKKYHVKVTNPGEQMTNTFHTKVYQNKDEWYNGILYKC